MGNRLNRPLGLQLQYYLICLFPLCPAERWYKYILHKILYYVLTCMYSMSLSLAMCALLHYSVVKDPNTLKISAVSHVFKISVVVRKNCRLMIAESGWMLST